HRNLLASKERISAIPESPAKRFSPNAVTPIPMADTTPSPVTTTSRSRFGTSMKIHSSVFRGNEIRRQPQNIPDAADLRAQLRKVQGRLNIEFFLDLEENFREIQRVSPQFFQ